MRRFPWSVAGFVLIALAMGMSRARSAIALSNVPPKDLPRMRVFCLTRGCYDFGVGAFGAGWMVPAALS